MDRSGFGGQSLIVELRSERQVLGGGGHIGDSERAGGPELNAILNRAFARDAFEYLGDIDEYGTTVFNHFQLRHVIPELKRLRSTAKTDSERDVLARVVELAERCRNGEPHTVLVFLGD